MESISTSHVLESLGIPPTAEIPNDIALESDLRGKNLTYSKPIGVLQSDVDEIINASATSINTLLSVVTSRDQDVETLANRLGATQAELATLSEQLKAVKTAGVTVAASELGVSGDQLQLADELRQSKTYSAQLKKTLERVQRELDDLNVWADEAEKTNARLQEQLNLGDSGLSKRVAQLERENEDLRTQGVTVVDEDRDLLTSEILSLKEQLKEKDSRIEEFVQYSKEIESYTAEMEKEITQLKEENKTLKSIGSTPTPPKSHASLPPRPGKASTLPTVLATHKKPSEALPGFSTPKEELPVKKNDALPTTSTFLDTRFQDTNTTTKEEPVTFSFAQWNK